MIRDGIVVVVTNDSIHHVNVAGEDLVQMSSLPMRLRATCNGRCEVAACQRLTHHRDVVVEVATHDDRGMRVLLGDVFGNVDNLPRSILQVLLFSRLNVAVEDLDSVSADLQLAPAEMRSHGLHQR